MKKVQEPFVYFFEGNGIDDIQQFFKPLMVKSENIIQPFRMFFDEQGDFIYR